jgi:hypothetical protein
VATTVKECNGFVIDILIIQEMVSTPASLSQVLCSVQASLISYQSIHRNLFSMVSSIGFDSRLQSGSKSLPIEKTSGTCKRLHPVPGAAKPILYDGEVRDASAARIHHLRMTAPS